MKRSGTLNDDKSIKIKYVFIFFRLERIRSETISSKMKEKSSKSSQDIVKLKNDQNSIKMINENSKESNVFCPVDKKQMEKMINDLAM